MTDAGQTCWRASTRSPRDRSRASRGREVDRAGDGFFATFDGPAQAIRCASTLVDKVDALGLGIRVGVHTGVRTSERQPQWPGCRHRSQVGALAAPGEILVSRTVQDLVVGSEAALPPAWRSRAQRVPGVWELYAVDAGDEANPRVGIERTPVRRSSAFQRTSELEVVAVGDPEKSPQLKPWDSNPDDPPVHRRLGPVRVLRRVDVDRGAVRMVRGGAVGLRATVREAQHPEYT